MLTISHGLVTCSALSAGLWRTQSGPSRAQRTSAAVGAPRGPPRGPRAPARVKRHLGLQVPAQDQVRRAPRPRHRRYLSAGRPHPRGRRGHSAGARALVRPVLRGASPGGGPGRPDHLQRRRAGPQARNVHDQLYGVGRRQRFDGRHPEEGPRGRPHPQGGMRHRLRVLHPAPARRVGERRRGADLRPALVHGHLRRDVLHGVVRGRAARRPDGDLRRRASGCDGVHPGEARGRPAPPVQPLAPHHPGVRGRGPQRPAVEARLPDVREREGAARPGRSGRGRVAPLAGPFRQLHVRPRGPRRLPRLPDAAGAPDVGRDHVLDLRLRGAGVRPHRRNQRDEQQLVLRGDPRHQPLRDRGYLGADRRRAAAGGGPPRAAVRGDRQRSGASHRRTRVLPDGKEAGRRPRDRGRLPPDPDPRSPRSPGCGSLALRDEDRVDRGRTPSPGGRGGASRSP